VFISISAFRLILCQKLLIGKNIDGDASGARKYCTGRGIGERSETHLVKRLRQKISAGVLRTSKFEQLLEKMLMNWVKDKRKEKMKIWK